MTTDKELEKMKKIFTAFKENPNTYSINDLMFELEDFQKKAKQQAVKDFAKKIKSKLFDKCELNPIVLKIIDDELKTYGVEKWTKERH